MGLSDAPRPLKRAEGVRRHRYRVDDGEAHEPQRRPVLPLLPGGEGGPRRENAEHRPGSLVEELPGEAPQDPERDHGGPPQRGQQVPRHGSILVLEGPFM